MAVFELIDGEPLSDRDLAVNGVVREVARLVAAIHAATPALTVPVPFVERFEVGADGLRRSLDRLGPGPGGADSLVASARDLVLPQRGPLLAMLKRVGNAHDFAACPSADRRPGPGADHEGDGACPDEVNPCRQKASSPSRRSTGRRSVPVRSLRSPPPRRRRANLLAGSNDLLDP
jgi:hypothetical protein